MVTTRDASFQEVPGKAPDLMGDYRHRGARLRGDGVPASTAAPSSFELQGERGEDGKWDVTPGAEADFRTRFLVRRPSDPQRFSGTVVVEWNNVSAGIDGSPDWSLFHRHLAAQGHAWVGVSAQKVGIDGGGFVEGIHLKLLAPDRYDTLVHPGDAWSFDIFSQVGELMRRARRGEPPRRPGTAACGRGGRVAVRRLPRDVHQRGRSARPGLRRLLRPRASWSRRHDQRRVHARRPGTWRCPR